jgi:hypothetical protein
VSYITGSHAFKVGMNNAFGYHDNLTYVQNPLSYRFRDGVPNQITMRALPHTQKNHVDRDLGLFIQDKWTINRATISLGLRYDSFANSFPEQELGPTDFTPGRNLTFPKTPNLRYHDITPKSQFAYDLFGNGRTALKVSLNRYLQGLGTTGALVGGPNPIAVLATTTTRTWTDANNNRIPDCNLSNLLAQDLRASGGDFCDIASEQRFGQATPNTTYDPELLTGWNKRSFNWEFSTGIQQEILPRVSVDVGYFRRWYGNFNVTDNRALAASDYGTFSVTAPSDPRLPDGGGHSVTGFKNLDPAAQTRPGDNYVTLARNFGKQIERWNGVDVTVNARLAQGVFLQGGTSTGRTTEDNCEILEALPEVSTNGLPYCHQQTDWLTQFKGVASYIIPRVDVSLAATYQYLPGPQINANWVVTNAQVVGLGRPLTGGNPTVNLIAPGTEYGPGLTQLDLRFGKILRFGPTRTTLNFDLYNATNSNTVLTHNNTYSPTATTWQQLAVLTARFFKFSAQFDF